MDRPTLRDEMDFEALPEDVKALARKVLGAASRTAIDEARSNGYVEGFRDGKAAKEKP